MTIPISLPVFLSDQAHLLYRKTSEVVKPYSIDSAQEEEVGASIKLSEQSSKYDSVPYYQNDS